MASKFVNRKKLKSLIYVSTSSALLYGGIGICQGNEKMYEQIVMPLGRLIEPETAHKLAIVMAKCRAWAPSFAEENSKNLTVDAFGLKFQNPVGMAAGFDKQGEALVGLCKFGFGFVEIGSVTPKPQPGNPKPRVFRLVEDKAVINRYGFNSDGHELVHDRVLASKDKVHSLGGVIGVNLGKNKVSESFEEALNDYVEGLKKFSDVADYFVVNVSSPNTPGLRDLQGKAHLEALLAKLNEERGKLKSRPPLLLKLAPDLSEAERQDVADVVGRHRSRVDGLVLTNTAVTRENLKSPNKMEMGGLSGAPLTKSSTCMIADMYRRTGGQVPIVGVGGVFSGQDAYEKIKAGASLVQIYTSYIFHGPPIVQKIKRELEELLEKDGHNSVHDAIGKNHPRP